MSTPLYEALPFDCQIFCFKDPFNILKENIYNKLEKRVHFINDIEDFKKKLALFLEGSLEIKKDNFFLNSEVINSKL